MKAFVEQFTVPIYEVTVYLAHDSTTKKMVDLIGWKQKKYKPKDDDEAFCYYVDARFAVGFTSFNRNAIAHELLHLTDQILERAGVKRAGANEAHTYLNGYLHEVVGKILDRRRIKVTP